jgi:preprotein translocase SecE subunit
LNPLAFLGRLEPKFIADIVSELRKVTWPTLAETRYLTFVVSVVAVTVGIFLGSVDLFFGWAINRLFF